jgi:hypothetical protein
MNTIRIVIALITVLILIGCIVLDILMALAGNWAAVAVITMICCGILVFVYNDYIKFFVDKVK